MVGQIDAVLQPPMIKGRAQNAFGSLDSTKSRKQPEYSQPDTQIEKDQNSHLSQLILAFKLHIQ